MAGQSAGQGESHVWRIDHHSIMDRHRCSLRSVVSPCDDIFVVFFLFFIYPLLLSDVLSSFCRLSSPSQWKVYAGYLTLSQMKSAIGNSVMLIISHPGFDTDNNNDIALMKLWTPLQISCELQYELQGSVLSKNIYTVTFISRCGWNKRKKISQYRISLIPGFKKKNLFDDTLFNFNYFC